MEAGGSRRKGAIQRVSNDAADLQQLVAPPKQGIDLELHCEVQDLVFLQSPADEVSAEHQMRCAAVPGMDYTN